MMLDSAEEILSALLLGAVEDLDIPADLYALAESSYQDVGKWLAAHLHESERWDVYPQGSFRLGTVVRPVVRRDDYDIDLVCLRHVAKECITQAKLKGDVGGALRQYAAARTSTGLAKLTLESGARCWTLSRPGFHMDVLPAIPDPVSGASGILLTDPDVRIWLRSDPIAFARWFYGRMAAEFAQKRAEVALRKAARIEDVPEWEVKTTLQRVVQVLKRHRDLYFATDLDSRPPSILLTTLAAHAYRGSDSLYAAVLHAARTMPSFVEETATGWRVENPVLPEENFADRWGVVPSRAKKFFAWLDDLRNDLRDAASTRGMENVAARLGVSFGAEPVDKAFHRLGETALSDRQGGRLKMAAGLGMLGRSVGATVPKHDFFGEEPQR